MSRTRALLQGLRRSLAILLGVVVGMVLLAWGAGYALAGESVPRGATVLGIDIGGLTQDVAEQRLEDTVGERAGEPLDVTVDDRRLTVDPASAGLRFDAAATVEAAGGGRSLNPVKLWRKVFGATETDPVVQVDESRLSDAVDEHAAEADEPAREGDIVFRRGRAIAVEPAPGVELDHQGAADAIRTSYLRWEGPVELPAADVEPAVDAADVERAMTAFARPAMSGPVVLARGRERVRIAPRAIGALLDMRPVEGRLEPVIRPRVLAKQLRRQLAAFEHGPRNAEFDIEDGVPRIVRALNRVQVRPQALAERIVDVLDQRRNRRVRVPARTEAPAVTTAEMRRLGVREKVSEFTTFYPYASYRVTNIGRAASLIDETLLEPGETFSLNRIVGERTAANGFAEGTIIKNGVFVEELGGGVSQVATTTFNAMFFAGLKDIEHKPHSFFISRYPEGREATVAWPTVDLKFKNDSPYGVLIDTLHNPGSSLTVRMWSTKHWDIDSVTSRRSNIEPYEVQYDDSEECVEQPGVVGFDVTVRRIFQRRGEVVKRENFSTRYNPADEIHCEPAPDAVEDDEPTPSDGRRSPPGDGGGSVRPSDPDPSRPRSPGSPGGTRAGQPAGDR